MQRVGRPKSACRSRFGLVVAVGLAGCGGFNAPPGLTGAVGADVPTVVWDATADTTLPPRPGSGYPTYDLSIELPYEGPEQSVDLMASTQASRLDVHISVDTTGSFQPEIVTIQHELVNIVVPGLQTRVPDVALGISRFADFPVLPYGEPTDHLYNLLTGITTDFNRVTRAVGALLPLQNGADDPEGWDEALYQIATGAGFSVNGTQYARAFAASDVAPGGGNIPGVGFRQGSSRVVINITDAPAHEPIDYLPGIPGVHGTAAVGVALAAAGAHFIGIAADDAPRPQMTQLCVATATVIPPGPLGCAMGVNGTYIPPTDGGCPLVFNILPDGTGLSTALLNSIASFLDHQAFSEIHGQAVADTQHFVTAIEATTAVPPPGTTAPTRQDRYPTGAPDGILDTFVMVPTRTQVGFRVHLRNTTTPSSEYPQVFFIQIQTLGDGVVLSQETLRVLVPEGPKPDSGTDAPPSDIASDVIPFASDASTTE